jgi:hypothetical protein
MLTLLVAGTLFRASQFLSEELPIRLAHRVQELGDLPDGLNDMPSIKKVQDWYAQSFEVCDALLYSTRVLGGVLTCDKGNYNITPTQPFKRCARSSHETCEIKWTFLKNSYRSYT